MTLVDALGVGRGDLVALVGGGGKTTAMYRLLRELRGRGIRAAAATTTKIAVPAAGEPKLVLAEDPTGLLEGLAAGEAREAVLGRRVLPGDKVEGIPEQWCSWLLEEGGLEALVVECDGAGRRPVKAPAEWEPVVPTVTTVFVAVLGLSCVGVPLDGERVFRPERVARVTGLAAGAPLEPAALARLLLAEDGLYKGCPPAARAYVLLNQADGPGDLEAAQRIAKAVLYSGSAYRAVVATCLRRSDPVRAVWTN